MEVTKMSSKLNKKDLKQIFIRYLALNAMNDYPGQMHNGYTFSLMPAIDKIYDKKEDRIEAKKRHMRSGSFSEYCGICPGDFCGNGGGK